MQKVEVEVIALQLQEYISKGHSATKVIGCIDGSNMYYLCSVWLIAPQSDAVAELSLGGGKSDSSEEKKISLRGDKIVS